MFGSERLRLLFTSRRILVDRVGKRGSGAVLGTSLLGKIGGALEDLFKSGRESAGKRKVEEMTPDQVLQAHKDNFAIGYDEVVSVTVEQTEMLPRITILTGTDKFEFSCRSRFAHIVETFKGKLGDRLTVQRIA
jgi:hypothetical protein